MVLFYHTRVMENYMASNGYTSTCASSTRAESQPEYANGYVSRPTSRNSFRSDSPGWYSSYTDSYRSASAFDSVRPSSACDYRRNRSSSACEYTPAASVYRRSRPSSVGGFSSTDYISGNTRNRPGGASDYNRPRSACDYTTASTGDSFRQTRGDYFYSSGDSSNTSNAYLNSRPSSACDYTATETCGSSYKKRRPKSLIETSSKNNYKAVVEEYNRTVGSGKHVVNGYGSDENLPYANGTACELTNGCEYSVDGDPHDSNTMPRLPLLQGSDRAWYRKVKEVLEAEPNKGPPYTPSRLTPHMYIGNIRNAEDFSLMQRLGITHVLNMAGTRRFDLTRSPYPSTSSVKHYLMIPAEDHTEYNIAQHFEQCIAFLNDCKHSGGIALLHCNLGINRSGAIAAVYLLADTRKPLMDVIGFLKLKRSVVLCNRAFRRQVIQYARDQGLLEDKSDRSSEQNDPNAEVKKRGVGRLFGRTNSTKSLATEEEFRKGHKRSKSDPVADLFVNQKNGGRILKGSDRPNGVVTPSMQRPLRLSSSVSSIRAPTPDDDEDEAEYKFDTTALDTLYEEIEQMNMTAPLSGNGKPRNQQPRSQSSDRVGQTTTSTIAIHVPEDPRNPTGGPRQGAQNVPRAYQNSSYLTVPAQRRGRSGHTRNNTSHTPINTPASSSRPRSVQMNNNTTVYRTELNFANGPSNVMPPTEPERHTSRSFFGTLFRRKPSSNSLSSNRPWRRSVHF